ncbi:MAG: hypothetical protein ACK5A0_15450 [Polaromonas sp.]
MQRTNDSSHHLPQQADPSGRALPPGGSTDILARAVAQENPGRIKP